MIFYLVRVHDIGPDCYLKNFQTPDDPSYGPTYKELATRFSTRGAAERALTIFGGEGSIVIE